jgi:hypothetical protein
MNLLDFAKRMPSYYLSGTQRYGDPLCVYLKSAPGRGKTTTIVSGVEPMGRQLGKNLGIVVINGGLLNPPDAVGYLVPRDAKDHVESIFTSPFWWRTDEDKRLEEYDGGIIFIDEADKMDVDIKKVVGEMALSGRLGSHRLPPGWVVWMAGNRTEDRSGSTKELDHLINRRLEIDVTDDFNAFEDWCVRNNVHPDGIAWAHDHIGIVFAEKVPDKQGPWPTPRSVVRLLNHLATMATPEGKLPTDPLAVEDAAGMIGPGAAAQLMAYLRLSGQLPKLKDIVADPKGCKVPTGPDGQILLTYNLAHQIDHKNCDPVLQYIDRFGKEFGLVFARSATKRDFSLISHPAFDRWITNNANLMAVISAS